VEIGSEAGASQLNYRRNRAGERTHEDRRRALSLMHHLCDEAPGVKQQLSSSSPCGCYSSGWFTGQVVPMSPVAAVRGRKHVMTIGKTPVLVGAVGAS
jgi:hypothetical protein